MAARILAVVERDGPDTTDAQYGDLFYFCVGVRMQFGSMDLALRGSAVACALSAPSAGVTTARNGTAEETVPPQRYVRTLLRTGVQVWVDSADLADLAHRDEPVLDGVVAVDADAIAARWHEYEEVWFL